MEENSGPTNAQLVGDAEEHWEVGVEEHEQEHLEKEEYLNEEEHLEKEERPMKTGCDSFGDSPTNYSS